MDHTHEPQFSKPIAVVDTNVMLEAASPVDMIKLYDRGNIDPRGPDATLRRQKARESLLLSMHLSNINATTFSLFEAIRITLREVNPDAIGEFETHAMKIWVHYVKDNVLRGWTMLSPSDGDDEPTGNGADELLVQRAKEYGVPLISHEGITPQGVDEKRRIRRRAAEQGVDIITPREFYGGIDELLHSALLLQRYDDGAEQYIRSSAHPEFMHESMLYLRGYYRHVLFGTTEGESEPLPVRLT